MPDKSAGTHSFDRSAMRASIIGFAAAAAADMLMAATLFAPSGALATTLAAPAGLKTAIHQSALAQQVPYVCWRGSGSESALRSTLFKWCESLLSTEALCRPRPI